MKNIFLQKYFERDSWEPGSKYFGMKNILRGIPGKDIHMLERDKRMGILANAIAFGSHYTAQLHL